MVVTFRLDVSALVLVEVVELVHEINRRLHSLFDLNDTVLTYDSRRLVVLALYLYDRGHLYVEENRDALIRDVRYQEI